MSEHSGAAKRFSASSARLSGRDRGQARSTPPDAKRGLYAELAKLSRLDILAVHEDTASISAQRNNNPRTGTVATEDRTGVVVCLWADLVRRNGGVPFPDLCLHEQHRCCLTDDRYWDEEPDRPSEQLFS